MPSRRALAVAAFAACAFAALAAASAQATPFAVSAPPSSLALSRDGKTLYVGLDRYKGRGGGVVAFARSGSSLRELGRVAVPGGATGIALAPDGATLVVATRVGLGAVSTAKLLAGGGQTVAIARDSDAPRTNQVVVSADGRYAFATNAETATLAVARIDGLATGTPSIAIVGHVSLDRQPGGLALSPDGATLYVTSEVAAGDPAAVPAASDPRLWRKWCEVNLGSSGVLAAIDVRRAVADPEHAVVARIAAGCAPTRVALSPDGKIAWVTVRGENRVVAFEVSRIVSDPSHALVADVKVGSAPIGLAYSSDGARLVVADSFRGLDPDVDRPAALSLVDTAAALGGDSLPTATVATGALAREVLAAPGGLFFVTDYNAKTIDVIALAPKD